MRVSDAEALFIQRRRSGLDQTGYAKLLGVAGWLYSEYEAGRRPFSKKLLEGRRPRPTDLERCVLMRRREGLTQQQLADRIGCSRLWVIRMENGRVNPDRLVRHWSS